VSSTPKEIASGKDEGLQVVRKNPTKREGK